MDVVLLRALLLSLGAVGVGAVAVGRSMMKRRRRRAALLLCATAILGALANVAIAYCGLRYAMREVSEDDATLVGPALSYELLTWSALSILAGAGGAYLCIIILVYGRRGELS